MSAGESGWFGVRCVFRSQTALPDLTGDANAYEERVTVWQASSFEQAIALAEADAREYAKHADWDYLDFAQAFQMYDDLGNGVEVFSLIRYSELEPDEYLTRFFDTGAERQRHE
jgi:soluble lytic murein transglycosylase-like protein